MSNALVMLLSLQSLLGGTIYSSQVSPLATFNGNFGTEDEVSCTAVVWASTSNPSHFVAAYSDGSLRIFDKVRLVMYGKVSCYLGKVNADRGFEDDGNCERIATD